MTREVRHSRAPRVADLCGKRLCPRCQLACDTPVGAVVVTYMRAVLGLVKGQNRVADISDGPQVQNAQRNPRCTILGSVQVSGQPKFEPEMSVTEVATPELARFKASRRLTFLR